MMRTILVGTVAIYQLDMHSVCLEAMGECEDALRTGQTLGSVFDAYARICDAAGMKVHRMNATDYSLGATFSPNWMDWPMFYNYNPVLIDKGMIFFLHMILMDIDSGLAMCIGHTLLVHEKGRERLTRHPMELVVC